MTTKQAIGELARHLGLNGDRLAEPIRKWPPFDKGTQADANAMIENRGFSVEGIRLARDRGLLRFGKVCGFRSWVVIDASGKLAQARRVDGSYILHLVTWEHENLTHWRDRNKTGRLALWRPEAPTHPLRRRGTRSYRSPLLHCLGRTATRHMRGCYPGRRQSDAGTHSDRLRGKRVRIFPHTDEAGKRALWRWMGQLIGAGAKVDAFNFKGLMKPDGSPVEDLNDFCKHRIVGRMEGGLLSMSDRIFNPLAALDARRIF